MIVRGLDSTGDWLYGKGIQDYAAGLAAVEQMISTSVQEFLGECWFAITDGIDWNNLLGKNNQLAINLAVSACILNIGGGGVVTSIVTASITVTSARKITLTYSINTIYGPLQGVTVF